jgi:predicted alpha/beta-hydrolase family hydrolase
MVETLIFPGGAVNTREWANLIGEQLNSELPTEVIEWRHWGTEVREDNWIEKEAQRVVERVGKGRINILAKSIGTAVAMTVLRLKPEIVNKLILCGVPLHDLSDNDRLLYNQLKDFPHPNLLCLQNENDNHGSFGEAEKFLHAINPDIGIISRPRADHDYPYTEDFINFLVD